MKNNYEDFLLCPATVSRFIHACFHIGKGPVLCANECHQNKANAKFESFHFASFRRPQTYTEILDGQRHIL